MYKLTWIDSSGRLFSVTSPDRVALWNLRYHMRKAPVKARLWGKDNRLIEQPKASYR